MAEVYCNVYKETDYSKFKYLIGNRNLTETRKKRIIDSIQKVGYVLNPIIVNEKMEIIDGQGRHAACKELGLPIYYVIAEGAGTDECVNLNIGQTNWSVDDYIHFYAEEGRACYVTLENWFADYPKLSHSHIIGVSRGVIETGGTHFKAIREGNMTFAHDPDEIQKVLDTIYENISTVKLLNGSKRMIVTAIGWVLLNCDVDADRLFRQIAKTFDVFPPFGEKSPEFFLDRLEYAYNKGARAQNCRYFVQPFKVYKRKVWADNCKNGLHAKKWREQQMLTEGA